MQVLPCQHGCLRCDLDRTHRSKGSNFERPKISRATPKSQAIRKRNSPEQRKRAYHSTCCSVSSLNTPKTKWSFAMGRNAKPSPTTSKSKRTVPNTATAPSTPRATRTLPGLPRAALTQKSHTGSRDDQFVQGAPCVTPCSIKVPGYYFGKKRTVFSSHGIEPIRVRFTKDGYVPKTVDLTTGPIHWHNLLRRLPLICSPSHPTFSSSHSLVIRPCVFVQSVPLRRLAVTIERCQSSLPISHPVIKS